MLRILAMDQWLLGGSWLTECTGLSTRPSEYDASQEVVISLRKPPPNILYVEGLSNVWKHAGRTFSLRDLKGKGCKVSAGALLPSDLAKVLDDKEKKKRKDEEKAAAHAANADIQVDKFVTKRGAGKEDVRKKRRVRAGVSVQQDSEPVSSPTPLNHAKPLDTITDTEYISPNASAGRMGALQNQTDEHAHPPPLVNVGVLTTGEEGIQENVNADFADEGHGPLLKTVERSARDKEKKDGEQLSTKQAECIEHLEEALRQSEADAHQLRLDRERYAVEAGNKEMVRRVMEKCLAIGKGFIHEISIGRKDPDIQAILKATPNVDPASSDIFMDKYEKLFDKRYPYVDKVARMYLLDPSDPQNVMPDETGPTPGGGPRDSPTTSIV
nr:hypothetical protein [Tanacetum cinerariifolium]